jgi:hypothetical protein
LTKRRLRRSLLPARQPFEEITDYNAEDESMADPDIEKKDAEVGEEVDVAVEEQEEEDKEGFEIDEEEDEEEEELIIGSDSARKVKTERTLSRHIPSTVLGSTSDIRSLLRPCHGCRKCHLRPQHSWIRIKSP